MNSKTNIAINELANLTKGFESAMQGALYQIVVDDSIDGDVRTITAMELTRLIDSFEGFKAKLADAMYPIDDNE